MIQVVDEDIKLRCDEKIKRHIVQEKEDKDISIKCWIQNIPGAVALTTDASYIRVYEGFVTFHFIDSGWHMLSVLLYFLRTPHTGEAFLTVMLAEIKKLGISTNVVLSRHIARVICVVVYLYSMKACKTRIYFNMALSTCVSLLTI